MKVICALLLAYTACVMGMTGIDVSQGLVSAGVQCMKQSGVTFIIARIWTSGGSPDGYGPATIAAAQAAGFPRVDGYLFPCYTCGNPASQVQKAMANLQSHNASINTLWLDVEGAGTYWSSSTANNQAFFQGLVQGAQAAGVSSLGVYTSASQWNPIMGSTYTGGSKMPLWYAHYDGNPSFSDFSAFGGWTQPFMKQYNGNQQICGKGVDNDFIAGNAPPFATTTTTTASSGSGATTATSQSASSSTTQTATHTGSGTQTSGGQTAGSDSGSGSGGKTTGSGSGGQTTGSSGTTYTSSVQSRFGSAHRNGGRSSPVFKSPSEKTLAQIQSRAGGAPAFTSAPAASKRAIPINAETNEINKRKVEQFEW